MSRDQHTPWAREGLNRSQWLLKHRGALNMSIQALSHPDLKDAPPATILRHIRDEAVPAPAELFALALQQSADFVESQGSRDHGWISRLRQAAELALAETREGEGEEEEAEETAKPEDRKPPARTRSTREALRRHLAQHEPKPLPVCDPLTGKPLRP